MSIGAVIHNYYNNIMYYSSCHKLFFVNTDCPNATASGESSIIHTSTTVTALITALALTGVAVLFY